MATALRILDDGAWVSVDDDRRVSVSELWRPTPAAGFVDADCTCDLPDLLVGGFVEVGVDGRTVEVRVYGDCIRCGAAGTTDWLPVGRLVDGAFRHVDRESVLRPAGPPATRRVPDAGAGDGGTDAAVDGT
jgi:hypothetical protein